jgi:hydroxymethylbilane synthase
VSHVFEPEEMLPAVAQGALALEARADDAETLARLAPLEDPDTRCRVEAERGFLRKLQGGCQVPIAGHAVLRGGTVSLRGLVASVDGSRVVRGERSGPAGAAAAVGEALAEELLSKGAGAILREAEGHAARLAAPKRGP